MRISRRVLKTRVSSGISEGTRSSTCLPKSFCQKVDDQEIGLFSIGKPVEVLACCLIARAAPDHLPQLDARVHGLHKHEIDDLWDVDAGVEHVDGDGECVGLSSFLNLLIRPSP